jgi:hypothetical protein
MPLMAQLKFNEGDAIKESHIDFTTHYIWFVLSGQIEIDGHEFDNSKTDCPIMFQANLDGVTLSDTCTFTEYTHRTCNKKGCRVIHLVRKVEPPINNNPYWYTLPNSQLDYNLFYHIEKGFLLDSIKTDKYIYETDGDDVEVYK